MLNQFVSDDRSDWLPGGPLAFEKLKDDISAGVRIIIFWESIVGCFWLDSVVHGLLFITTFSQGIIETPGSSANDKLEKLTPVVSITTGR